MKKCLICGKKHDGTAYPWHGLCQTCNKEALQAECDWRLRDRYAEPVTAPLNAEETKGVRTE